MHDREGACLRNAEQGATGIGTVPTGVGAADLRRAIKPSIHSFNNACFGKNAVAHITSKGVEYCQLSCRSDAENGSAVRPVQRYDRTMVGTPRGGRAVKIAVATLRERSRDCAVTIRTTERVQDRIVASQGHAENGATGAKRTAILGGAIKCAVVPQNDLSRVKSIASTESELMQYGLRARRRDPDNYSAINPRKLRAANVLTRVPLRPIVVSVRRKHQSG